MLSFQSSGLVGVCKPNVARTSLAPPNTCTAPLYTRPTTPVTALLDRAILTVDIGTSTTKAALYFLDRPQPLGPVSHHSHQSISTQNLHVTQRTHDWYQGTIQTLRNALATPDHPQILAIALTGQMQDLLAVGPDATTALTEHAILYSDCRAQHEAAHLSAALHMRIPATSLLSKLRYL